MFQDARHITIASSRTGEAAFAFSRKRSGFLSAGREQRELCFVQAARRVEGLRSEDPKGSRSINVTASVAGGQLNFPSNLISDLRRVVWECGSHLAFRVSAFRMSKPTTSFGERRTKIVGLELSVERLR